MPFVKMWVDLDGIRPTELSQMRKIILYDFTLYVKSKKINE